MLLTDATGALVERYRYDPFRQPAITTPGGTPLSRSAFGNPFLYTGARWTDGFGLLDRRARVYAPALGRFCSPDPLGQAPGLNRYPYVGNNPVNRTDPLGLLTMVVPGDFPGVIADPSVTGGLPGIDRPAPPPGGRPPVAPGTGPKETTQGTPASPKPGMDKAHPKDEDTNSKKGGQKGKGRDIQMVDDVGKELGMDPETRREFGRFVEESKGGDRDYSYQELIQLAHEFLGGE